MISDTLDARERISLITTIFSAQNGLEMVGHLHGEDAQAFVDIIDKVCSCSLPKDVSIDSDSNLRSITQELDNLEPRIRRRCLRYLYRICGRQSLIPRTLEVEAQYDQKGYPLRNGGFADVWMGQHNGREVAVKVLRVYLTSDFEQIRKVGRSLLALCIDELTLSHTEVLQGGHDVERPPPSECIATTGSDDDRESVRDDIGVDG